MGKLEWTAIFILLIVIVILGVMVVKNSYSNVSVVKQLSTENSGEVTCNQLCDSKKCLFGLVNTYQSYKKELNGMEIGDTNSQEHLVECTFPLNTKKQVSSDNNLDFEENNNLYCLCK